MTPQEMFNRAYIGVIQQGQAGTRDGSCAYYRLAETGPVMCGIGHVVGEDHARALSAQHAGALCDIWSEHLSHCDEDEDDTAEAVSELLGSDVVEHWTFADALQEAHDTAHSEEQNCSISEHIAYSRFRFLENFRDNMAVLAKEHGLTIPEVPNVA